MTGVKLYRTNTIEPFLEYSSYRTYPALLILLPIGQRVRVVTASGSRFNNFIIRNFYQSLSGELVLIVA